MKLIDLSHPMLNGQKGFPSDPSFSMQCHATIQTERYNLRHLHLGSHHGTHVDALSHFIERGRTLDEMPLEWFCGETSILRIPKQAGEEIDLPDLIPFESFLIPEAKIIYATGWHREFGSERYFTDFPSLTEKAARFLAAKKIRMLGMDTPTPSKQWYEVHHILLGSEIVVVESLARLDQVPDQIIFLGFPLRIYEGDGSPIRAVAMIP